MHTLGASYVPTGRVCVEHLCARQGAKHFPKYESMFSVFTVLHLRSLFINEKHCEPRSALLTSGGPGKVGTLRHPLLVPGHLS